MAGRGVDVEEAKRRCKALLHEIEHNKILSLLSSSPDCKNTLSRLINSELSFLSRLSLNASSSSPPPLSVNIGHLEAVVHILQQPYITNVSRVCKSIPLSPPSSSFSSERVYVDIVCSVNGNPVWFVVSDRNPKYICWEGSSSKKGLRTKVEELLSAAQSSLMLRPSSVIFFFSNGLAESVCEKFQDNFGATYLGLDCPRFSCAFYEELEDEWVNILNRSYKYACILEVKVDSSVSREYRVTHLNSVDPDLSQEHIDLEQSFCSLISGMKSCSLDTELHQLQNSESYGEATFVNFDTTALIAIVSGISNGGTEQLLAKPEDELRSRFKGNYEFVIAQVNSEIQKPILVELADIISGKTGIICESVFLEFQELVSMCGGRAEKFRANYLLKHINIVPDCPSTRMLSVPTTRKLASKNKVVFGTGDYWHAPTLTANMAFVRAILQTGMSLFTIEHRPRALVGD